MKTTSVVDDAGTAREQLVLDLNNPDAITEFLGAGSAALAAYKAHPQADAI